MVATAANMKLCSDDLLQINNVAITNEKEKHYADMSGKKKC